MEEWSVSKARNYMCVCEKSYKSDDIITSEDTSVFLQSPKWDIGESTNNETHKHTPSQFWGDRITVFKETLPNRSPSYACSPAKHKMSHSALDHWINNKTRWTYCGTTANTEISPSPFESMPAWSSAARRKETPVEQIQMWSKCKWCKLRLWVCRGE